MSSAKQRRTPRPGSQASLSASLHDELEMHEKTRPGSAHSRNAWSTGNDVFGGGDEIDFSPRAPASAAVDLSESSPSGMAAEPVAHQRRITADARAPGTQQVPVGCWTRFKRIVRGRDATILSENSGVQGLNRVYKRMRFACLSLFHFLRPIFCFVACIFSRRSQATCFDKSQKKVPMLQRGRSTSRNSKSVRGRRLG